jgi:hypothetical protein
MALTDKEMAEQVRDTWTCPIQPECPHCGYLLIGLPKPRCPECGHPFNWSYVAKNAQTNWYRIQRLRNANADARTGLYFVGGALPVVAILNLIPAFNGLLIAVANIGGFVLSIVGLILGWQVFGILRVPARYRKYIEDPPNPLLGLAVVLLSFALLAVVLVMLAIRL